MDRLDHFIFEFVGRRIEALLPQNLTDEWLNLLLVDGLGYLEMIQGGGVVSDNLAFMAGFLLLAFKRGLLHRISYQVVDPGEVDPMELSGWIRSYTEHLQAEKRAREQNRRSPQPTLDDILPMFGPTEGGDLPQ